MNAEIEYLNILKDILNNGETQEDRTGVGTLSVFGRSIRHQYKNGFPLLTTKKIFIKGVLVELLWFLKGTEDASYLLENNVHIWDAWMQDDKISGKKILPHTYGVKWRNFYGTDQISKLIHTIKSDPNSRRLVVSAWDAANVDNAALPWCHILWQIDVTPDKISHADGKKGDMNIAVYQRSADWFLGVPWNLCNYSFLLYMIAEITNYRPKEMYYTFGNCHIYKNHIEQCKEQISRLPYNSPNLKINHRDNIDHFIKEDFEIMNYECHPSIKGDIAV